MPPHSYTHTLYIPWVYILKQLLMEIYGRCSLTRPRTLLILNYIMLHHTIIFNLELHVQISKRCICGSENSSKIKIAIKNEKFWAEKPLDCQLFMKETIEKSPRHLFPSQFLGNRNCNVSEHENLLHHFSVYIIIWHDKELLIRAKKKFKIYSLF